MTPRPRARRRPLALAAAALAGLLLLAACTPAPDSPQTPGALVRAYLDAVARGDADAALALALEPPTDTTFLTSAVLAESNKRAPLSKVTITREPEAGASGEVIATYQLGETSVEGSFHAIRNGSGYRLGLVASQFRIPSFPPPSMGLSLDGTPVTTDVVTLFPGHYRLTASSEWFSVTNKPLIVESPAFHPTWTPGARLTKDAIAQLRRTTVDHLKGCLAQTELHNEPCGIRFDAPAGVTPKPGSFRCRVTKGNATLPALDWKLSRDATTATSKINIQLTCSLRATDGGTYSGDTRLALAMASLADAKATVTLVPGR